MAIIPKPPGVVGPPNDLTEQPAGSVAIPNNLTELAAGSVAIPNDLTELAAGSVAVPNNLTEQPAGSVSIPNNLTELAPGSIAIPNDLTEQPAGSVAIPNDLTEQPAGTVAIPNVLAVAVAGTIPRSIHPVADFDFAANCFALCGVPATFDDLFTYSRNTTATFINRRTVCGKFDFFLDTDFVGDVENLASFSEQFDNAVWTQNSVTVLPNVDRTFDGRQSADKVIPDSTGTFRGLEQAITLNTNAHSAGFRFKADGFSWVKIVDPDGANGAWFNIALGAIGTISAGTAAKITPLDDGWVLCEVMADGAVAGFAQFAIVDADNTDTVTANGTAGVLVDAGQVTESAKPQPYVKTLSSTVIKIFTESLRREFDFATGAALGGKLEPASTNLALHSEKFNDPSWAGLVQGTGVLPVVTANVGLAPDGTRSADRVVFDSGVGGGSGDRSILRQSAALLTGSDGTESFWLKSNTGAAQEMRLHSTGSQALITVGSEWVRFGKSVLDSDGHFGLEATGTDADQVVDILTFGAQLEALDHFTSYIHTEDSTVSRAADNFDASPALMTAYSSPWAIVLEFDISGLLSGNQYILDNGISGTAARNSRISPTGTTIGADSGSSSTLIGQTIVPGEVTQHVISRNAQNDRTDWYLNGVKQGGQNLSGSNLGWASFSIGSTSTGTQFMSGHIKIMRLFDVALTEQEITFQ